MKRNITAIIQARMNSRRLPNKALLKIGEIPMLLHVINQAKASKYIKNVIIATTNSSSDKKIVNFCIKNNIDYFRGSSKDVLDRYYKCGKKFSCNPIVRISSDCPFIDPIIIDKTISKFLRNSFDYIGNNLEKKDNEWQNSLCKFPQGMVIEICKFQTLEEAWNQAQKPSEREHVFPYIQFNPKMFKVSNIFSKKNFSFIRCTVDHKEDLKFVREIWKRKSKKKKIIHVDDIVKIILKEPNLLNINSKFLFDEGYQKSLKLDTIVLNKNKKSKLKVKN